MAVAGMNWLAALLILALFGAVLGIAVSKARQAARLRERQLWTGIMRDIAHQFGTPLSALMGWADILPTAKSVESVLPEMQRDLERLGEILNRLSQVGAPTRLVSVDVSQMLGELRAYFQKRLPSGDRGVTIVEEIAGNPTASGQPDLLSWALEHLIKNAADALDGKAGRIIMRAWEEGGNIAIQIQDSGRGISIKPRSKIFTPGFTTKNGGRGLGLSLVSLIVEEFHRGSIYIEASTAGEGTTIRIHLPKGGQTPT